MVNVKEHKLGKNTRMSFSRSRFNLELPNLVEIQTKSFDWFLKEGLMEVLRDVSPITDYSGNLSIEFISYSIDTKTKYPIEECKERDVNYAAPLKVNVRLTNKQTGDVKYSDIYLGDFPLMTETGTFVINGAERVIVSQLVRSPGMYYSSEVDKTGKKTYAAQIIPYRGAWLEYESDIAGVLYVRIDKNRKVPMTMFIRALGVESREDIYALLGEDVRLATTFEKDECEDLAARNGTTVGVEALKEIYKKLRPGEPPLVESAQILINNYFFDSRRYDIQAVGRYKYDKKMAISERLANRKLAEDAVSPITGEVIFEAGTILTSDMALAVERAGINEAVVMLDNGDKVKVLSNNTIEPEYILGFDLKDCGINEKASIPVLLDILAQCEGDVDAIKEMARERIAELCPKHITKEDIFASINYMLNLTREVGKVDDIDHLGNRRVRSVGEQLQNQMRIGFSRMDKIASISQPSEIKEFFTTASSLYLEGALSLTLV